MFRICGNLTVSIACFYECARLEILTGSEKFRLLQRDGSFVSRIGMLFRNVPYLGTSSCNNYRARSTRAAIIPRAPVRECARQLSPHDSASLSLVWYVYICSTLPCPSPCPRLRTVKRKRRRLSDVDRLRQTLSDRCADSFETP